jgi:dTDP-4-amino-4,6-dideoxygalactose transaminase
VPNVRLPHEPDGMKSNWQSYCVRLPERCDQRTVMARMLDAGVATRRGIMCAHREPAYPPGTWTCAPSTSACPCGTSSCTRLPQSEAAQDHCILLPLFQQMTDDEQQIVAATLKAAVAP